MSFVQISNNVKFFLTVIMQLYVYKEVKAIMNVSNMVHEPGICT